MARRLWDKGDSLDPDILAYTVGDDHLLDLAIVEEDCWGSLAHSAMLAERGLLGAEDRDRIAAGLREILAEHRAGRFAIAPEEEDVHTAIEGRLSERIGEAGRRLHTGRSRNDQVLVDLRLYAKRRLLDVVDEALALASALCDLAAAHEDVILPGYTHLRQAMPSTVGLWAAGHAELIEGDVAALRDAYRACDASPLGSAAGFGTPLPLDRDRTAELLGFSRLQVNVQAVQSSRGKAEAQALFACTLLGGTLAKLSWDLQLGSAPELGFFRLPGKVATGSSIMPQKKNPDVLELTRANAAVLASMLDRILGVTLQLPSSYHRDYQLTKRPLIEGLPLARSMARALRIAVEGLEVDRERARAALAPEALATHRAIELVRGGMPFRDAYRQVARELAEGEAPLPSALEPRSLYAVKGSAGDLRLDEARARLAALAEEAREVRRSLEERLTALEAARGTSP
ncbi:MAG: argininosuccinate lyase [Planctomycetota bacterium]|nr:MAG: argininosuccinate lyase [Planctomycetota bacterium]